jgi:hypothetical protein
LLSVECKRPHRWAGDAIDRFRKIAAAIKEAMTQAGWPEQTRLEVEIIGTVREEPSAFAQRLLGTLNSTVGDSVHVMDDCARVHVVPRSEPFRVTDVKVGKDVMVLPAGQAFGLFNPAVTTLRVVHRDLDQRFARSAGAKCADALKQLPECQLGLIFLGDIPLRIASQVFERRIHDSAYDQVVALGVLDGDQFSLNFREHRRSALERLFRGMRGLYATG